MNGEAGGPANDVDGIDVRLPRRLAEGHKGTFGTVAVVGGCAGDERGRPRMIGGVALAALGALRAGCGLVRVVAPGGVLDAALTVVPEATGVALPMRADGGIDGAEASGVLDGVIRQLERPAGSSPGIGVLVVGPGLGEADEGSRAVVMKCVSQDRVPVVLDADGLNALSTMRGAQHDVRAPLVMTPHPGEWSRLAEAFGLSGDAAGSVADRREAARSLAGFFGCVCVLKGSATVVATGVESWSLDEAVGGGGAAFSANAALATAGTGDVLSGVIGGLIAQHVRSALMAGERSMPSEKMGGVSLVRAAAAGVVAHAEAGRRWSVGRSDGGGAGLDGGLLARELLDGVPGAVAWLRGG